MWDLFMWIMRVKCRSHEFVPHKFFIAPYVTIHKALEHKSKSHKFIKRPVLTNLHKFLTCIKMSLYGIKHQANVKSMSLSERLIHKPSLALTISMLNTNWHAERRGLGWHYTVNSVALISCTNSQVCQGVAIIICTCSSVLNTLLCSVHIYQVLVYERNGSIQLLHANKTQLETTNSCWLYQSLVATFHARY